jgi:integrase
MFKVFIDTSVWFDIAQDAKRFYELGVIDEMIRRGVLELIVPKLAIDEFHRKRESIVQSRETGLQPHIRAVRDAARRMGGNKKALASFLAYLETISSNAPVDAGETSQALSRIERWLESSPVIEQTDAIQNAAIQRGIDKRAPFQDKNGMADAILIETYAQCVRKDQADTGYVFVTHNKNDFSQTNGDQNFPHPHLTNIFSGNSRYFIDLLAALKHIEPSIVAEVVGRNQPTLGNLIERYLATDPDIGTGAFLLRKFLTRELSKKIASKLRPQDYLDYAKLRGRTVSGATVNTDFAWLKKALLWAHEEISGEVSLDVFERGRRSAVKLGLIAKSKVAPTRRLAPADEQRIIEAFRERQQHKLNKINMVEVFQFAIWSARSAGEICRLEWSDFDQGSGTCLVKNIRKRDKQRRFPLLGKALEIVNRRLQEKEHPVRIFPYHRPSVTHAFTQVKDELEIDITFDDLRDESIRRFLEAKQYPMELIRKLHPWKVAAIEQQLAEK